MANVKDFLNPSSMMTPGIAGAITTGITMPLVDSFELKFKWVALVIGFMLALLIVAQFKDSISRMEKAIYCVLNTLIIFSVSVGAGNNLNPPPQFHQSNEDTYIEELINRSQVNSSIDAIMDYLKVQSAHANETGAAATTTERPATAARNDQSQKPKLTDEEVRKLKEYLKKKEKQREEQQKYYQRWSW